MNTFCTLGVTTLLGCVVAMPGLLDAGGRAVRHRESRSAAPVSEARQELPPKSVIFDIDRSYGTLQFQGTVERIDLGEEYEFRPHIAMTFKPGERTNRTPVADLSLCVLIATIRRDPDQPVEVLSRQTEAISVRLTEDGETRRMPDLVFRLSKRVSAEATHVGLGVSDGRLLWPIPTELK